MFSGVAALGRTLNAGSGRKLRGNSAGAGIGLELELDCQAIAHSLFKGTNCSYPPLGGIGSFADSSQGICLIYSICLLLVFTEWPGGVSLILECRNGPTGVVQHLGFV